MEYGNENQYLGLYKAAARGDWNGAKKVFDEEPDTLINNERLIFRESALYIAVQFGHSIEFVQNLVNLMSEDAIAIGNKDAVFAHEDLIRYLLPRTHDENPSPFRDKEGVKLLNYLILADFYDIALHLLKAYPALAHERGPDGNSALDNLAKKPHAFPSGNQIGYCWSLLYQIIAAPSAGKASAPQGGDVENQGVVLQEQNKSKVLKLFPFLLHVEKTMLMNKQALELLRILISEANTSESEINSIIGPAVLNAARVGIQEFVAEAIKSYPYLIWFRDRDGCNIFHLAIKHGQEKVFSLIYQTCCYKHVVTYIRDRSGNNILHLAGKLKPCSFISGAALQMQRELEWFQAVEKIVQPSYKQQKDGNGRSPREVFTEEHESLVEKGEKWMKDAATSCATVAALVITVVFAAAFTSPGGNRENEGTPNYLNKTSFMIFVISDALGLFSSSTSLLMFLGILTSRYSEKDFLRALPMRLSIGLITLFFSIASMLIAFSAALHLVLFQKVKWIAIPIGFLACVPVTLFALLQYPLLVEMVSSTFGRSVFRKQSEEIIF